MRHAALLLALTVISVASVVQAGEIGFVEEFALSADREAALGQLVPGTEDYYYYHCLHYQNSEQFDKVEALVAAWIKRHGETGRVEVIRNRQALLTYPQQRAASLTYLQRKLDLRFDHQPEATGTRPDLPTALDGTLVTREAFTKRALARHKDLDGFAESSLDWLIATKLSADQRRQLLHRLTRSDHEGLAKLVVDDLNHKYSKGFGSHPIHGRLLLVQLDELLNLKPDLRDQNKFVQTYLVKLQPSADADAERDPQVRLAHLERLWKFVETLSPAHNSLKAHVLYRRLVHDRSQGIYDRARFLEYLKLPRRLPYVRAEYLKRPENQRFSCNLSADFSQVTRMPPVGNDEPLVRSYLAHFFVKDANTKAFDPYVDADYLKHLFAETKIVNGLGEPERWASLLPPQKFQALKERVDLDFAPTNPQHFGLDAPVQLDVDVKNVRNLIVKVYEINTANFYRTHGREVNTNVNLDGLVPNHEQTLTYREPPLRRVRRRLEFPQLDDRGVYVIDLIGSGMSSRALVRKGRLRYLVRTSTAGQVFTVLDEGGDKLPEATLWMGERLYRADDDGTITVPYSTQPGRQPVVLGLGDFATLEQVQHAPEQYRLAAGIYVDREALLSRRKAEVVIRPGLYLNGAPVTLSVLEDIRLHIHSTDRDGTQTTQEVTDVELREDRETLHEFQVPPRLASISFMLRARVQSLTQGKKLDLQIGETFSVNAVDATEKIEEVHLANLGGEYTLEVLGRMGEPRADRPVNLKLVHRDFSDPLQLVLKSDAAGRVALGPLPGIESVIATPPSGPAHAWPLRTDEHSYPRTLHGTAGEPLLVPYMGTAGKPGRDELSLLELRGGSFTADHFDKLSIGGGYIRTGKLPAGDYSLLIKPSGTHVHLRLAAGPTRARHVVGARRHLEVRDPQPLQITALEVNRQSLVVALAGSNKFTRVHLFATRYEPAWSAMAHLGRIVDAEPYRRTQPVIPSLYIEGRNIGDEYRYILDRQYGKRFPGNMLRRPSLLLNPWAVRETATDLAEAMEGEEFGGRGVGLGGHGGVADRKRGGVAKPSDFNSLEFLADASAVRLNLAPNAKGFVRVPRNELGPHQRLYVVAIDPQATVVRGLALPEVAADRADLRLVDGLDPQEHFTQQKQVTLLAKGEKFVLPDITTSQFEVYDSLPRLYALLTTLSGDVRLAKFDFILRWHELPDDEKREKYSRFACHELNFFLLKKDPQFFAAVVRPYLAHKREKTIVDRWLLERELAEYLRPWNHAQLNVVERILLGRRIEGEQQITARQVADEVEMQTPDVERLEHLFLTALGSSALETDDPFGVTARTAGTRRERRRISGGFGGTLPVGEDPFSSTAPQDAPVEMEIEDIEESIEEPESLRELKKQVESRKKSKEMAKGRSRGRNATNDMDGDSLFFDDDADKRLEAAPLYRPLDQTKEWAENQYYELPLEEQNADLVGASPFWREYAAHPAGEPFLSMHVAETAGSFTEMMFALAVTDLPAESPEHESKIDERTLTLTAGGPLIVFHQQIRPAEPADDPPPILVSQNIFRHDDRYRQEGGRKVEKYVSGELLAHVVYGCRVVVTNPTSAQRKLTALLQIPVGAMPVLASRETRSANLLLEPYQTETLEYHFYFPTAGRFAHYPVQVAEEERLVAHADPTELLVVEKPTKVDRESWAWISQYGKPQQVLKFLQEHNLYQIDLDKIAFRMADKGTFTKVTGLLARRHSYNHTLWSYGIRHDVPAAIREYLRHSDGFVARCGSWLDSPLLVIDPVERRAHQHLDYLPLVNARAHRLGKRRQILNDRFHAQYHRLMEILSCRRELDDGDRMAVVSYMLLQDRVEEALAHFDRVHPEKLETRIQYDYCAAYLDFYDQARGPARPLAEKYADHPVDRWREAFATVRTQLDEIEGATVQVVDREDRDQVQTQLAADEPSFDFKIDARQVRLTYQNLSAVRVNYYLMDVELLFSRNPFVQQHAGQFSHIRPNATERVELPAGATAHAFTLPEQLHNRNVLVEIVGAGKTRAQAYYSHSLAVQLSENYGQLRVAHAATNRPQPQVYVKVYARHRDGQVKFYKDGYTDLRGRFDYSSLSTDELDHVDKLAVLVLSDEHGAVIRETPPPKR